MNIKPLRIPPRKFKARSVCPLFREVLGAHALRRNHQRPVERHCSFSVSAPRSRGPLRPPRPPHGQGAPGDSCSVPCRPRPPRACAHSGHVVLHSSSDGALSGMRLVLAQVCNDVPLSLEDAFADAVTGLVMVRKSTDPDAAAPQKARDFAPPPGFCFVK